MRNENECGTSIFINLTAQKRQSIKKKSAYKQIFHSSISPTGTTSNQLKVLVQEQHLTRTTSDQQSRSIEVPGSDGSELQQANRTPTAAGRTGERLTGRRRRRKRGPTSTCRMGCRRRRRSWRRKRRGECRSRRIQGC